MRDIAPKDHKGKPPMDLIPHEALEPIANVMGFGADKYGEESWRKGGVNTKLYGAAMRHMIKWKLGEQHLIVTGKQIP